ncbi:transposase [Pseudoclavibacter helvolus]|uniref:transposase n=1 Tax=Pseudoclavibacter helvolus TaxID=255205 RepID=UPI002287346E|nr:transposase [Pseudoclavibacter helvolus]
MTAWMGMLGHPGEQARRWEPKRLRYRLFSLPASLAKTRRRITLHLSDRAVWATTTLAAISRLRAHARAPG